MLNLERAKICESQKLFCIISVGKYLHGVICQVLIIFLLTQLMLKRCVMKGLLAFFKRMWHILYLDEDLKALGFVFSFALFPHHGAANLLALRVVGGNTSCLHAIFGHGDTGHVAARHVHHVALSREHRVMNNRLNFLKCCDTF